MTSATLDSAEVQRRFADYAHYHRHLRIVHRDQRIVVPLELRKPQRQIYNRVVAARREQRPFRGICLKARQLGVSTFVQSFFACEAFTKSGVEALTIAHDIPTSKKLHQMLERMYDQLPPAIKPPKDVRERGKTLSLIRGANPSNIDVRTAGSETAGRGFAITHLHASEFAYWPNAEDSILALRSGMQPLPGTFEMVESTANGMIADGQLFYEEWQAAEAGESDYEPFFFPWYLDAAYAMPVTDELRETLDGEEKELQRRFGITLEQLAWRRWCIQNRCGRKVEKFHQDFPTTAGEAFLSTGRPFFDARLVEAMPVDEPKRRGYWRPKNASLVDVTMRSPLEWVDSRHGEAAIWRVRHPDHRYVVAVDPAGQVSDAEADAFGTNFDAEDYSVITVIDRASLEVCAQWRDRTDLGLVGYHAAMIGRVYGNAILAVEKTGGYGQVVLDVLKRVGYSPQYHREVFDEKTRRLTKKLGWDTTESTRPKLLEGLADHLRDHAHLLHSADLQREMRTMIRGRRPEAAPGQHDDVVFSTAIALEVAKEHPHTTLKKALAA